MPDALDFETILLERQGDVAYVVMNRPDKFNALSTTMIREMTAAFEFLRTDASTRAVILRSTGKHFCTGHDLSEMTGRSAADYRIIFEQCRRMMDLIHDIPQPVIAQVQGVATAAGCQLTAAADLAVAEENARFATPGVRIGLFCSTPMVPLSRAVGRKRALEMLLTGRNVPAAEALDWGLVNQVVPPDQLAEKTMELAQTIVSASPLTVAIGKQTFYAQIDQDENTAYDIAVNAMTMNLCLDDAQEGITAFLEKRKPTWTGR